MKRAGNDVSEDFEDNGVNGGDNLPGRVDSKAGIRQPHAPRALSYTWHVISRANGGVTRQRRKWWHLFQDRQDVVWRRFGKRAQRAADTARQAASCDGVETCPDISYQQTGK